MYDNSFIRREKSRDVIFVSKEVKGVGSGEYREK